MDLKMSFIVLAVCKYIVAAPIDEEINNEKSVCDTRVCNDIGSVISKNLNTNINPCDDFFEYACGGWVENNPVPKFSGEWSRLGALENDTNNLLREILENRQENSSESLRKAQDMYKLCMNTDRLEERGVDPLLRVLEDNNKWPIAYDTWNETGPSWISIHERYIELAGHSSLFSIGVQKDPINQDSNIFQLRLTDPLLTFNSLLNKKNLRISQTGSAIEFLHLTVIELHRVLNSTRKTFETTVDIFNIVPFQSWLVRLFNKRNETSSKVMTINEIQQTWNELIGDQKNLSVNWLDVFNLRTKNSNFVVTESQRVSVNPSGLLGDLVDILKKYQYRVLVDYIHWTFVKRYMKLTNSKMYSITESHKKREHGYAESPERWRFCVDHNRFQHILNAEFIKRYVDNNIKKKATDLAEKFRIEFTNKIGISYTSVYEAIKNNVGYPDWYLDTLLVDNIDKQFNLSDDYFESYLAFNKHEMSQIFGKLAVPDRGNSSEWSSSLLLANANYDTHKNLMTIPVGILRFPLYHDDLPPVFLYSQIGTILGHELSHAFTHENKYYLLKEGKCIQKQYGKYLIGHDEKNEAMYLNGGDTLDENVADNIGLNLSYELYKKMKNDGEIKEKKIPELSHFNDDQLFFLGFANTFCGKETNKFLVESAKRKDHAPFKWRIHGAVSNIEDFGRAFDCPVDSPMNPSNKCRFLLPK